MISKNSETTPDIAVMITKERYEELFYLRQILYSASKRESLRSADKDLDEILITLFFLPGIIQGPCIKRIIAKPAQK
ncbi:hypothetical protein [Erwinia sp. ErVv1]|uniref:hypothetical protein n=1 Tax=Erwinia sp. ErVv1 TaxID=1603299 RepID=UPI000829760F|nr:hypothetical protein [Erwinia sp. ErVv1]